MTAYPWSLDAKPTPPPTARQHKLWRFIEHHLPNLSFVLMILALILAVLYPYCVVTVPSGQVGVLWKRFDGGTVLDTRRLKDEGLHIILPWDQLFLYDLRLQSVTESYNAITKDGVSLTASINIRFQLEHDAIPRLHQEIGPDYLTLLVRPEVGSRMREVISEFIAEDVYSTRRQEIQEMILKRTQEKLGEKLLLSHKIPEGKSPEGKSPESESPESKIKLLKLHDTLVLGMDLPQAVVGAINRKTEQYYIAEEYKFRITRETRESERKRIEAKGIHDFQEIVSQGISDSYLRWKGIEATLQLAQSTNAKIVVIGSGKDGLPIILNMDTPSTPAATTPSDSSVPPKGTAPAPSTPTEKPPAAGLTTPSETPAASTSTPDATTPAASPTKPSATTPAASPTTPSATAPTASPTTPSATTPSATTPSATTPSSSTPAAAPDKKPAVGSATPSSTTTEDSHSTWADIKAILSRILPSTGK